MADSNILEVSSVSKVYFSGFLHVQVLDNINIRGVVKQSPMEVPRREA